MIKVKRVILYLILLLFLGLILPGCGSVANNSGGEDNLWSWDSAAEEAAVASLSLEAFEIFPVDLEKLFRINDPTEKEQLKGTFFITPFSRHTVIGNHTEGRGKWYLSCDNESPVYAPAGGILTQGLNEFLLAKTDADLKTVSGESVYNDSSINFYVSKHTVVTLGHMGVLASIKQALQNASDGYTTIQKGQLLGFGPMGAATLDFQIRDGRTNNGISSVRYADINTYTCPMQFFTSALQTTIESYYQYNYEYYQTSPNMVAPESKYNSPLNINVTDEVWGTWWYKSGLNHPASAETAAHCYNMGIIALLSWNHGKINSETFNIYDADSSPPDLLIYNFVGIYNDQYGFQSDVPYYQLNYLYAQNSITSTEGLFLMSSADFPGTYHYLKYKVYLNDPGDKFDNELHIGIACSEADAVSAFNANPIIYITDAKRNMGYQSQPIAP